MSSFATTAGARLAYADRGSGPAVLALHGAASTHEEIQSFLDPLLPHHRRIYPDLPGHGESGAEGIASAAEAVTALEELVDRTVGHEPFCLVAHSFGAHLARGLAARRPGQVDGLALICPMVPDDVQPDEPTVVVDDGAAHDLPPDLAGEYTGYFVVRTAATAARFREAVAPSLGRFDGAALEPLMTTWQHDPAPTDVPFDRPVLILAGRRDSWVGHRQCTGLLAQYPGATAIILADAGHALPHEHRDVLAFALERWLAEVEQPALGARS